MCPTRLFWGGLLRLPGGGWTGAIALRFIVPAAPRPCKKIPALQQFSDLARCVIVEAQSEFA
jgi:hypothetical protein